MIHSQDSHYLVAASIVTDGPISRTELVQKLKLSAPTLTRITRTWIDAELIEEVSRVQPASGRGRPTVLLDINPKAHSFIGVIVTPKHIYSALVNARLDVLAEFSTTLSSKEPESVADQIAEVVVELKEKAEEVGANPELIRGVSVCVRGRVKKNSMVVRSIWMEWNYVDLGALLADRVDYPVSVANSVNALTMWERLHGVGKKVKDFSVLTVGRGVEHGLVYNHGVVSTPEQGVGYLDHLPVPNSDRTCYLGHKGCTYATLSTEALIQFAQEALEGQPENVETIEDVLKLYEESNANVAAVVEDFAYKVGVLATAIATISMTTTVAVTGSSVPVLRAARQHFERGLESYREENLDKIQIELRDTPPTLWATAAALPALEHWMHEVTA